MRELAEDRFLFVLGRDGTAVGADGSSTYFTPVTEARYVSPVSMIAARNPERTRVLPAFFPRGFANAGTAVATVWTPASATEPEEKARSTMRTVASPRLAWSASSSWTIV